MFRGESIWSTLGAIKLVPYPRPAPRLVWVFKFNFLLLKKISICHFRSQCWLPEDLHATNAKLEGPSAAAEHTSNFQFCVLIQTPNM
jgi:hypothetical protein